MSRFQTRSELEHDQNRRFASMLRELSHLNRFVTEKYRGAEGRNGGIPQLEDFAERLPFTRKQELVEDQLSNPPYGRNLSYPESAYVRIHQTSGTTGTPLFWLDTRDSWSWFLDCWKTVLRRAGLNDRDRVFVAFSFGPFLGFWGAFEAAQQLGALTLTGGALNSTQRLDQILHRRATVLVCTPTYALHLAEVARSKSYDLPSSTVTRLVCAGEPGASVPNVRARLEQIWGARVYDHAGATEVGAWGLPGDLQDSLLINEDEFIAEVIDPVTLAPTQPDADGRRTGELVLTNLGRTGMPVIRYRTGDLVTLENEASPDHPPLARLVGGVLGRVDDMLVIRGVNVYPSAIENHVRAFDEIEEFQLVVDRSEEMHRLIVRIECPTDRGAELSQGLERSLHDGLSLRTRVEVVPLATLPRFELKAKRILFVDQQV